MIAADKIGTLPRIAAALIGTAVITAGYGCFRSKPNFTGIWRLDTTNSQSQVAEGFTVTTDIRHNDPFIHVRMTVKSNEAVATTRETDVLTNGRETVDPKTDEHTTAKWEGDVLTMVTQDKGSGINRWRWTLSPDGNTLTWQSADDTSVQRLVFLKL